MSNIETPVKVSRNSPKVINPRNILFNNQGQNVSQEIQRSNGNSISAGQTGTGIMPKELLLKSES